MRHGRVFECAGAKWIHFTLGSPLGYVCTGAFLATLETRLGAIATFAARNEQAKDLSKKNYSGSKAFVTLYFSYHSMLPL